MEKMSDYFISQSRKESYELIKKYIDNSVPIIVLTGESGVGKSRFIRQIDNFIGDIRPIILDSFLENTEQLLRNILKDLGVDRRGNKKEMMDEVAQIAVDLKAEGKKLVIIIDDISGITEDIIGEIIRLFDYEFEGNKVLTLIMVTNNQDFSIYREWVSTYFKYLNQAICYLNPLTKNETIQYFKYVCDKNGLDLEEFKDEDYHTVYEYTEGIPDRISKIAELLKSFGITGKITIKDVHSIVKSANIVKEKKKRNIKTKPSYLLVAVLLAVIGGAVFYISGKESKKIKDIKVISDNKSQSLEITDNKHDKKDILKKIDQDLASVDEKKLASKGNSEAKKSEVEKKNCVILKANLKLRIEPDKHAEYLMVIPKGTNLVILEKYDGWVKVNYKKKVGWIKGEQAYIKDVECQK
ncbi:AAA family ATPase [Calditerrivibrio sp.]|uniref:AAA family ATPase n=1 Tax=Calditerrivibrio sp. TaxID=2792612 RepID=UPI003D109870